MAGKHRPGARRVAALALGMIIGSAGALAGCAAYANYPSIGRDAAVNDPNVAPLPTLAYLGVRWTVDRYPVEGAYVVNWPRGMGRARATTLADRLGDGARLVSPGTRGLPTYHVSRIWLRGDRAEVDVMRPVGGPDAGHQMVTVHLRSDLGRWEVASTKLWPVGMGEVPELYGWEDDPGEADAPEETGGD